VFNITPFYYAFEETYSTLKANSASYRGLRANGTWNGLMYEASVAQQRPYQDGTATKQRMYRMGMVGYKYQNVSLKAVRESLEDNFQTPLAALHGFYGYSDRISATPANGLIDDYLQGEAKAYDISFEVQTHHFKAERTSQKYGNEVDVMMSRPFGKYWSVLVKYADYRGDSGAPATPTTNPLNKDIKKFWLMTTFKF
jgi:hypothetical protein